MDNQMNSLNDQQNEVKQTIVQSSGNGILQKISKDISQINFREEAKLRPSQKLTKKQVLVVAVNKLLQVAKNCDSGFCRAGNHSYVFNGAYWQKIEDIEFTNFMSNACAKMGVDFVESQHFAFKENLRRQFSAAATRIMSSPTDKVLINLKNGTLEISSNTLLLREFKQQDCLTYQLPFPLNEMSNAPIFQNFLDDVLPDKNAQDLLAEYLGSIFIKQSDFKIEKMLLLYGSGANGKSVIFDVINALLGANNITNFPIENLIKDTGYCRAQINGKLLNYASETSADFRSHTFKVIVSREPLTAREIYGSPFTITDYPRMMLNSNDLPKNPDAKNAFFRRIIIIPFNKTIPEDKQDKELAKRIIANELSGVFNWVLDGLRRLLENKIFSNSKSVRNVLEELKDASDTIRQFMDYHRYRPSITYVALQGLYEEYVGYCDDNKQVPKAIKEFGRWLREHDFECRRQNFGIVVFVTKS